MNVSLTPELEAMVQEKVASGLYSTASEVVRESLRLLKERDDTQNRRLAELKREIAVGLEQLERGQYTDYTDETLAELAEDIKRRGQERLAKRRLQTK